MVGRWTVRQLQLQIIVETKFNSTFFSNALVDYIILYRLRIWVWERGNEGARKRDEQGRTREGRIKTYNDMMLRVSPPTSVKPVNNLICCKTGLIWVRKRTTTLFNLFCGNVARQVARFLLPVCPSPKGRARHTPQSDTCLSKHVPKAKFLTGCRLDRMASLHTGSRYKLQVRKGMGLFTSSKAALGIKL